MATRSVPCSVAGQTAARLAVGRVAVVRVAVVRVAGRIAVAVLGLTLPTAACGGGSGGGNGAGAEGDASGQVLVVSAASSLTDVVAELVARFEAANPGVDVLVNLDSSSSLAAQAAAGAPVDVFASADALNIRELQDRGLVVGEPEAFARNELVLVTPRGNPRGITGLGDLEQLAADGSVVALCAADSPCGRLAGEVLDAAGVSLPEDRVSRAPNARSTLGAVRRGDAAAALAYTTDVLAAGDEVDGVPLEPEVAGSAEYVVAALGGGDGRPDLAAAFVDLVTSSEGREVLTAEGFG